MTDEELKEMQEEYPNAWWNLNHDEYEMNQEDFDRAWEEDCGAYFDYCSSYLASGFDWYSENHSDFDPEVGDEYGNLMLSALLDEKWNIVETLDAGDSINRDAVMQYLFTIDCRKQMQWLLDHDCHRRDDVLWDTWHRFCFEWDNK